MHCDRVCRTLKCVVASSTLLALLLALGGWSPAAGRKADAEVKVAANATKIDEAGKQTVTITLTIEKDWHIYANPIRNETLLSAQTDVKISAKEKVLAKVIYPAGKFHKDKIVGDYHSYEDKVAVKAEVQRTAGDASPLEIQIRFVVCNEKTQTCKPGNLKVVVP